ncbi:hypothetical protein [Saccharothrix sp. HUAS TT1]|uniref:hypothetical protein n=1 Tax=unclassified Saccharothrix TaxID=2593673 RepID=UPI00345BF17B
MAFREVVAALSTSVVAVAALVVAAPSASAAAKYCNYNLSADAGECFYSHHALAQRKAALAQVDYIHVVNWVNYNTGAGVLEIGGSSACTLAIDNEGKKLPDLTKLRYRLPDGSAGATLNNSISSVKVYNGCVVQFFDGVGYSGAVSPWTGANPDLSYMGFYDRASSLDIT